MAGGKYVKGQPSSNPAGRPTRAEAMMRKVKPTLVALGATDREISAMATAFAERSMEGVQIVMSIICMRFDAAKQAAELAEQADRPGLAMPMSTVKQENFDDFF